MSKTGTLGHFSGIKSFLKKISIPRFKKRGGDDGSSTNTARGEITIAVEDEGHPPMQRVAENLYVTTHVGHCESLGSIERSNVANIAPGKQLQDSITPIESLSHANRLGLFDELMEYAHLKLEVIYHHHDLKLWTQDNGRGRRSHTCAGHTSRELHDVHGHTSFRWVAFDRTAGWKNHCS